MAAEMFDKLDALFHLLPELDMTINARRYDEISLCRYYVCDDVAVHVTFFIAFRVRQVGEEQFLVFEYCGYEELMLIFCRLCFRIREQ